MDVMITLIVALFICFSSIQYLVLRNQKRQVVQLNAELDGIRHQMDALLSGTKGVVGRVRGIEQRLRRQGDRQDEMHRQGPESLGLKQAVELVRKGASLEELMETCNLSRGESELLIRLYAPEGQ